MCQPVPHEDVIQVSIYWLAGWVTQDRCQNAPPKLIPLPESPKFELGCFPSVSLSCPPPAPFLVTILLVTLRHAGNNHEGAPSSPLPPSLPGRHEKGRSLCLPPAHDTRSMPVRMCFACLSVCVHACLCACLPACLHATNMTGGPRPAAHSR